MAIIFDGKAYASQKEEELKKKVIELRKKEIVPKLISIIVGEDPASLLYVNLKKKAAERIGAEVEVVNLGISTSVDKISKTIKKFDYDDKVQGIMVQLPLPLAIRHQTLTIVNSIAPAKDVDGLGKNSPYVHPTAKAVLQIIEVARLRLASARQAKKIAVVGEKGMVGKSLIREIVKTDLQLIKETTEADVVISAAGSPGIIKADMIKNGAIVIDVGSPKGDVSSEVIKKALFITPVPGGVGPVTISCLLENLVIAS